MNLRERVEETADRFALPSLSVTVAGPEGMESVSTGDHPGSDPVYPIASITKTFTAFRVLELVRQGGLHLEGPLKDQLPGFALWDSRASDRLTLRDALCHFSGLPPHTWAWVVGDLERGDWIRNRLPFLAAAGPHREQHRYSNMLYAVLGQLIEEVTGHTWEVDLRQEVTEPAGLESVQPMDRDWVQDTPAPWALTPEGGIRLPPFWARAGHPIAPASELQASVTDLARWGLHVLNAPDIEAAFCPQNRVSSTRPHPSLGALHYGMGWRLDTVAGRPRIWHSGQCSGFASLLSLEPERGTVFAAACNVNGSVDVLHALNLCLREGTDPEWANIPLRNRNGIDFPVCKVGTVPVGVYQNPGYGPLEISEGEHGLESVFQEKVRAPLLQGSDGTPRLHLPDYGVTFPVRVLPTGALSIPFEPAVEAIDFEP